MNVYVDETASVGMARDGMGTVLIGTLCIAVEFLERRLQAAQGLINDEKWTWVRRAKGRRGLTPVAPLDAR